MTGWLHVTALDASRRPPGDAVNLKNIVLFLLVIIVVLGATGGDASAAAVGRGIGQAFHLVQVAWEAMVAVNEK